MFQKHVLENGLRVILVPKRNTQIITLLVLFGVGSRYEAPKLAGVSHFIEHMMFKGTKRRPTTLDISRELDTIGAEYNAFTAKDLTGYYIKSASKYLDLGLDILSDMLLNSKFEQQELEREKGVIIEEIRMYFDNPMFHIEDMIENLVFKGNTLGRSIAGDEKSVRGISREAMLNFFSKYYHSKNAVIVAAGNVESNALKLIKDCFKNFRMVSDSWVPTTLKFKKFKPAQKTARLDFLAKKTEQLQLAIGFPAYSYSDKKLPALNLLSVIFGGTMSSRLFIEVRERRGLAYFIRTEIQPYQDTGIFTIRAGLDPKRLEEAMQVISKEIYKIKKEGVTEGELRRAKKTIEGRMALDLEDSSALAGFYGKQEILGEKVKTPEEKLEEIKRVTLEDVLKVAREILQREKSSLAVIGPDKSGQIKSAFKSVFDPDSSGSKTDKQIFKFLL